MVGPERSRRRDDEPGTGASGRVPAALALFMVMGGVAATPSPARAQILGPDDEPPSAEVFSRRDVIEPLVTALDSSPESFRVNGAWALGKIGPLAKASATQLARKLTDRRAAVRRHAAVSLVKLGAAAIEPLREALVHENPRTRRLAAWSLGTMGPAARAALPQLRALMLDETQDPRVRRMAFRARERISGG